MEYEIALRSMKLYYWAGENHCKSIALGAVERSDVEWRIFWRKSGASFAQVLRKMRFQMWELPHGSIRSAGTGEWKLCTTEHNRKEDAPEEQNGEEEAPEEQNREEEAPEEQNREEDRVGRDCQNSNRVGARRRMMQTSRRVGKRL